MQLCGCRLRHVGGWGGVRWDNNVTGSLTHTSCYATVRSLGLPRIRHATLLYVLLDFHAYVMLCYWTFSWTSTHTSCYATATVLKGSWKNLKRCCKQKTAEKLWKRISWGLSNLNKTPKWRFRVDEMTVIFLLGTKAFTAFTLKSHAFLLARAHQTWSTTSHESKKHMAI